MTQLKKIHPTAHWTHIKYTPERMAEYCQKEATRVEGPWQYGEIPTVTQGKRTDIANMLSDARSGMNLRDLSLAHPTGMMRYSRHMRDYLTLILDERDFMPRIYIFYGPTGTGKSCAARKFEDPCSVMGAENGKLWHDGYDPTRHKTIVYDDFYGRVPWCELLRMCDRYAHRVHTKGNTVPLVARTMIFTSNADPKTWYPNQDWQTLARRVTGVVFFGETTRTLMHGVWPEELGPYEQ